jgi:cytochrome c oxidase subunit 3
MLLAVIGLAYTLVHWWRDVIHEGRTGHHTDVVSKGLRIGMALFITSEVLFFFAFFWAYFWGALYPPETTEGYQWLPEGAHPVETWDIPFLNTMILLLSGCTVTWAHHAIREDDNRTGFKALALTVALGVIFTAFQAYEYVHTIFSPVGFQISSGIFGSTFYMATGFHGFHVMIGTSFLAVCMMRAWYGHFRADKHVGLEAAAWYWHFVDVVWLFLFAWVYWWGGHVALASAGGH